MANYDEWNQNAQSRHEQLLSGADLSFSRLVAPRILNELRSTLGHKSFSVIEAGCGTGVLAKKLARYCKHLTCIDPSMESIRIATTYLSTDLNVRLVCASLEEFKTAGKFDLMVSNMTLHAIPKLATALKNANNLLKRSGKLIFSIPHPAFWPEYKELTKDKSYQYSKARKFTTEFTISNDQNPMPSKVPYIHRSLEAYSKILGEAGFGINRIFEPFPSEKLQKQFKKRWTTPHAMVWICGKN